MSLQTHYHVDVSHLDDFVTSSGPQGFYDDVQKTRDMIKKFKKNAVLLVIDPQNSFMEANPSLRRPQGSLYVPNSNIDIHNIIQLVNDGYFHEVHVSLDTHSPRHIAHPGFWMYLNEQSGTWEDATDAQSFNVLKNMPPEGESGDWYIEGTNIFSGVKTRFYPKKTVDDSDGTNSFGVLCTYVRMYINAINNGNGHQAIIWPEHCLESTYGHEVAQELKTCLDSVQRQNTSSVFYHTKGRNNLAEMYSIFSAEFPVHDFWLNLIPGYAYEVSNTCANFQDLVGSQHYKSRSDNIYTSRNNAFLARLFGENNTVYVCGEARTHCVKASVMDMIQYVKEWNAFVKSLNMEYKTIHMSRIVLLLNSTSPIGNSEESDNESALANIMRREGCVVMA